MSTAELPLSQVNVGPTARWRSRGALVVAAWALAAVLPLVGLISLLLREQLDPNWSNPRVHFTVFLSVGVGVFVATVLTWNPRGVGASSDVLAGRVAHAGLSRFRT